MYIHTLLKLLASKKESKKKQSIFLAHLHRSTRRREQIRNIHLNSTLANIAPKTPTWTPQTIKNHFKNHYVFQDFFPCQLVAQDVSKMLYKSAKKLNMTPRCPSLVPLGRKTPPTWRQVGLSWRFFGRSWRAFRRQLATKLRTRHPSTPSRHQKTSILMISAPMLLFWQLSQTKQRQKNKHHDFDVCFSGTFAMRHTTRKIIN